MIGAVLGTTAPGYYRSVFRNGDSPDFNPIQVGIGLGATQGIASGVVLSIVVFAFIVWRDLRTTRPTTRGTATDEMARSRLWTIHALWCVGTILSGILIGTVAFLLGGIIGQQQLYQSWTDRKLKTIATILESSEFVGVQANFSSAAQVYLTGTVNDDATHDTLHDRLITAFGIDEADEMIWRVDVSQSELLQRDTPAELPTPTRSKKGQDQVRKEF